MTPDSRYCAYLQFPYDSKRLLDVYTQNKHLAEPFSTRSTEQYKTDSDYAVLGGRQIGNDNYAGELLKQFSVHYDIPLTELTCQYIELPADYTLKPHTDLGRNHVVIFPLMGNTPTDFYKDGDKVYSAEYASNTPVLVNARREHGAQCNSQGKINFQIGILSAVSYKHILDKLTTAKPVPLLLHPPKTGGTSLRNAVIEKYGAHAVPVHINLEGAHNVHSSTKHGVYSDFAVPVDYPAVISVRNPYTRMWSMYKHAMQISGNQLSFAKFLLWAHTTSFFNANPCSDWLCENIVDTIRYESYTADIKRIYDIDIDSHEHIYNTGAVTDCESLLDYMTDDLIQLVNQMLAPDFENFGYKKYTSMQEMRDDRK